jgi:hypothetical protein
MYPAESKAADPAGMLGVRFLIARQSGIGNELDSFAASHEKLLLRQKIQRPPSSLSIPQEEGYLGLSKPIEDPSSLDQLLVIRTRDICKKNSIQFAHLSSIQRKFVTHYRCNYCGLLPLYHLNLLHVKRVRCRKCGELIAFKAKGKYGKLRKEIAFQLVKEMQQQREEEERGDNLARR